MAVAWRDERCDIGWTGQCVGYTYRMRLLEVMKSPRALISIPNIQAHSNTD